MVKIIVAKRGIEFKVFSLLKENGSLRVSDIANYLNIKYRTAFKTVKNLEKKGYVKEIKPGLYSLEKRIWAG